MFKKIMLLLLLPILVYSNTDINYDGLNKEVKDKVDILVNEYNIKKIYNLSKLSNEYIYPSSLGENLLTEIDKLKTSLKVKTEIDIFKISNSLNILSIIGTNIKFLEKGNELNLNINGGYGYNLSTKKDNFNVSLYTDVIFRKTNTVFRNYIEYTYNKNYGLNFLNGYLGLANQFIYKNVVFDIGANYAYILAIPKEILDEREILYKYDKNYMNNILNILIKMGYKFKKDNMIIYPYIGFDYDYDFLKEKNIVFEKQYNIKIKNNEENMYFIPNVGMSFSYNNTHYIELKASYILGLKNYNRFLLSINYSYNQNVKNKK